MEQTSFDTEEFRPTIPAGLYQHYSGKMYRVFGVARHSESGEWFVVYRKQYDDFGLAIRPYDMFVSVSMYEGKIQPRFARLTKLNSTNSSECEDPYAGDALERAFPDS